MSEKDTNLSARDQARQMAERNTRRSGNAVKIAVAVGVLLVIAAIVAVTITMNQSKTADYSTVTKPSVVQQEGVILGEGRKIVKEPGETNVVIYQDYLCPGCAGFKEAYQEEIDQILDQGLATVEYRTIGMLDTASQGSNYSSRAANASLCVAQNNGDSFHDFNSLLYANQPAEGTKGLSNDELIKLAESAGATDASSCIEDGTYRGFVKQLTSKILNGQEIEGTPTVLINGEIFDRTSSLYEAVRS